MSSSLRMEPCGRVHAGQARYTFTTTTARKVANVCVRPLNGVASSSRNHSSMAVQSGRRHGMVVKAVAMDGDMQQQASADDVMYETLIVLRADMTDEERDVELAKFQAFLQKQAAQDVQVTVRGRQRLAYPIKGFSEGIYVLYTFKAAPRVSQAVQKMLSTPEAGSELNILRHMTFKI